MKALSLIQPWATLIAIGANQWETRSWHTKYRGRIAIHASKSFPVDFRELCFPTLERRCYYFEALNDAGIKVPTCDGHRITTGDLPLGAIIAMAEITECISTEEWMKRFYSPGELGREYEFGDYSRGRFAWRIENVRRLKEPVPCKGSLGIWNVPEEVRIRL